MSAHTPGPWVWHHCGGLYQVGDGKPYKYGLAVACVSFEDGCDATIAASDADATLLAAAPDLLDACKKALNFFLNTHRSMGIEDGSDEELVGTAIIRSAIAKATQP